MKVKYLLFIWVLLTVVILPTGFCQDNTQIGLPDGAIARLGKGRITVMQFSSDGVYLAVGTTIGVWLYNVNTRNAVALFPSQSRRVDNKAFDPSNTKEWQAAVTAYVNHLAFSNDNRILATGESKNGVVQLWDVVTGEELLTLPLTSKSDSVSEIGFSTDDKTLITPTNLGDIYHWDVSSGNLQLQIGSYRPDLAFIEEDGKPSMHSFDVLALSANSTTFVSGDPKDGKIRLWETGTGRQLSIFKAKTKFAGISRKEREPQKGIHALVFSSDTKTAASGHDDNTVRLWNVTDGTEIATLKGHTGRINTLKFSPNKSILASSSADKTIVLWNVDKKRRQTVLTGHRAGVRELTFSPDGNILASGSMDGTIRFWNANTGREMSIFATGHTGWIGDVAFSADNTTIATATSTGSVQIWNVETGQQQPSPAVAHYDTTTALAFSQDATLFASNGADATVRSRSGNASTSWSSHSETRLWSLIAGEELHAFPQSSNALAFSPDNRILAISNPDETSLWNINTGSEISRLNVKQFFTDVVVTFSQDGTILATGGIKGVTHFWDVNTGQEIFTIKAPIRDHTKAIAISPDNTILAVVYVRNQIYLWDLKSDEGIHNPLTAQKKLQVGKLIFSPDGEKLLIATRDSKIPREIQVWDVKSGQQYPSIQTGHTLGIHALVFSSDGKTLASGDADGTVLLWDWEKISAKNKPNKINGQN